MMAQHARVVLVLPALVLLQVLQWSGQAAGVKGLRRLKAGASWRLLSHAQKAQLVWALDAMDWGFIQQAVEVRLWGGSAG